MTSQWQDKQYICPCCKRFLTKTTRTENKVPIQLGGFNIRVYL